MELVAHTNWASHTSFWSNAGVLCLPHDVQLEVACLLDVPALLTLRQVCRLLSTLTRPGGESRRLHKCSAAPSSSPSPRAHPRESPPPGQCRAAPPFDQALSCIVPRRRSASCTHPLSASAARPCPGPAPQWHQRKFFLPWPAPTACPTTTFGAIYAQYNYTERTRKGEDKLFSQ
ncbi:hypothetical protein FRC06_005919 [Ceratobasidium sp. 370]|nr:hypothetical protein FRC06_005919 [Ceratobasidium sp. 370]